MSSTNRFFNWNPWGKRDCGGGGGEKFDGVVRQLSSEISNLNPTQPLVSINLSQNQTHNQTFTQQTSPL